MAASFLECHRWSLVIFILRMSYRVLPTRRGDFHVLAEIDLGEFSRMLEIPSEISNRTSLLWIFTKTKKENYIQPISRGYSY